MPVKIAAVPATTSERTPMPSNSATTRGRYAARKPRVPADLPGQEGEPAPVRRDVLRARAH